LEGQPLLTAGVLQFWRHAQVKGVLPDSAAPSKNGIEMAADHPHGMQIKGTAQASGLKHPSPGDLAVQGHDHVAGDKGPLVWEIEMKIGVEMVHGSPP
jgi:hypothetical protein